MAFFSLEMAFFSLEMAYFFTEDGSSNNGECGNKSSKGGDSCCLASMLNLILKKKGKEKKGFIFTVL